MQERGGFPPGRPKESLLPPRGEANTVSFGGCVPDTASLRQGFEDYALLWVLVLIVAVLSVLPLARLLLEAIAPNGQLSTRALTDVLSSATTWSATRHSLATALGGTVLALVVGGMV